LLMTRPLAKDHLKLIMGILFQKWIMAEKMNLEIGLDNTVE
jgi:hypothetical protein